MKIDDVRKLSDLIGKNTEENYQKMLDRMMQMGIDPAGIYQELEMSSRYVDTHRDESYSNFRINLHSHNFYELIYCRQVPDMEYLIGTDRYRICNGDIICVPPGVSHRPILPEKLTKPYIRDVLWLSQEFVTVVETMFPETPGLGSYPLKPLRTADTRWADIGDLFSKGVQEAEQRALGWEAAVVGNALTIFARLRRAFDEHSVEELKKEKRELLDGITAFVEENYCSHISLQDVAKRFYVSESTVSHIFKQRMGVSLYHYVTQRRLIAAKNLILRGAAMETVAEQVGFSDYSAFYRAFKGEFGISPRQFRAQSIPK